MKSIILAILMGSLFSSPAFAECKSVMGTCVKQDLVNSAPHMRSDYVEKRKVVKAVQAPVIANTANSTASNNNKKIANKTNSTGVFSTMQKANLK